METVTVNVQITLDVRKANKSNVLEALNVVNQALSDAGLMCEPQILTNGLDDSDITYLGELNQIH
jgi:hypothetical protein